MKITKLDRQKKIISLWDHPHYHKKMEKLKDEDLDMIRIFIDENGDLPTREFEMKINRLFMDREKPKRWIEISEILSTTLRG